MIEDMLRFYYFSDNGSSTLHNEKDKTTSFGFFIFIMPYRLLLSLIFKPSNHTLNVYPVMEDCYTFFSFVLKEVYHCFPYFLLISQLFEFGEDIKHILIYCIVRYISNTFFCHC